MRYREIIKESVDYLSFFNPILNITKKYLEEESYNNNSKTVKNEIKKIKSYTNKKLWISYYLSVVRSRLANELYVSFEQDNRLSDIDRKDYNKLLEVIKYPFGNVTVDYVSVNLNDEDRYLKELPELFRHYEGINYEPIQDYNPFGNFPSRVTIELSNLEDEYKRDVEKETKFLKLRDNDEIIKRFNDGFVWIMLDRGKCSEEADAMGHCGNINPKQTHRILSLRKEFNDNTSKEKYYRPHLTFIYDSEKEKIVEAKGRTNSKPSKKYHPYIVELFKMNFLSGLDLVNSYESENDFHFNDLDYSQMMEIVKNNKNIGPSVFSGNFLDDLPKNIGKYIENETKKLKDINVNYNENDVYYAFKLNKIMDIPIENADEYFNYLIPDVMEIASKIYDGSSLDEIYIDIFMHIIQNDDDIIYKLNKLIKTYDINHVISPDELQGAFEDKDISVIPQELRRNIVSNLHLFMTDIFVKNIKNDVIEIFKEIMKRYVDIQIINPTTGKKEIIKATIKGYIDNDTYLYDLNIKHILTNIDNIKLFVKNDKFIYPYEITTNKNPLIDNKELQNFMAKNYTEEFYPRYLIDEDIILSEVKEEIENYIRNMYYDNVEDTDDEDDEIDDDFL